MPCFQEDDCLLRIELGRSIFQAVGIRLIGYRLVTSQQDIYLFSKGREGKTRKKREEVSWKRSAKGSCRSGVMASSAVALSRRLGLKLSQGGLSLKNVVAARPANQTLAAATRPGKQTTPAKYFRRFFLNDAAQVS